MHEFSAIGAWSHGFRFAAARPAQYLLLLVGIGLLVPYAIQFALTGAVAGIPVAPASDAPTAADEAFVLVVLAALLLQAGSFFAAWRLGFGERETLARALLFGLVSALIALVALALLLFVASLGVSQLGKPGIVVFALLLALLPAVLALATFCTTLSALAGVGLALLLLLTMVVGTATGNMGMAATLTGGSGFVTVMLLILSAFLLWLAARLSCTTAILADRKSYNLFAAMRASWTLTWEDQLAIMRYLAVLGAIMAVLMVAVMAALGGGAMAIGGESGAPQVAQAFGIVTGLFMAIPFAFLALLVPAGIYRQLVGERAPVEIFA